MRALIAVLGGDGIGPEVVAEALKVLKTFDPAGIGEAPSACEEVIAISCGAYMAQQIEHAGPVGATERAPRFPEAS